METVTNTQKLALVQLQDLLMDNLGCTREEATEKVLSIMKGIANA